MSSLRGKAVRWARRVTTGRPGLKKVLVGVDEGLEILAHGAASRVPALIKPNTRKLTVAITARCNLRCQGCRYERDFMLGEQLSLEMVKDLLDDGAAMGVETVRLYGGEPLLHRDLPAMVEHAIQVGIRPYVTTNGMLLDKRIDELVDAGLRDITLGFYGFGDELSSYVQRENAYERRTESLETVSARHGDVLSMQLNYLIMKGTATVEELHRVWDFAGRFGMALHTDLVHYSLPYFTPGLEQDIQFTPDDRPDLEALAAELARLATEHPERLPESPMALRSIPDWLLLGPQMRIPCDARNMVWIGANGVVQLCYVTFELGNLHERRLSEILYTDTHTQAARDAFQLNCPNCHCERDNRVRKHLPSRRRYGG